MTDNVEACTPESSLYVCGTPIGNLEDVSFRLLEVLRQVDLILCEDTRKTSRLLARYEIKKPLVAFHEHVEERRTDAVLHELSQGKSAALVSDAGMPVVSDPGAYLVKRAREAGFQVVVVPGPSAVTAALALSGFRSSRFVFAGFPPRKSGKRRRFFDEWIRPYTPTVFFESPYRLVKSVKDLKQVFPTIQIALCHEMTKAYESAVVGPISEVYEKIQGQKIKGEWVMVSYLDLC